MRYEQKIEVTSIYIYTMMWSQVHGDFAYKQDRLTDWFNSDHAFSKA